MKVDRLKPEFVEEIPHELERGVLYISIEYGTCGHACACGCGSEVMTPLSPAQWAVTYDGAEVSLWPSVGNWALACRSHYVLDRGRVRWSRAFSDDEIARNRGRDQRALTRYDRRDTRARGARNIDLFDKTGHRTGYLDGEDRARPSGPGEGAVRDDAAETATAARAAWWRRFMPGLRRR